MKHRFSFFFWVLLLCSCGGSKVDEKTVKQDFGVVCRLPAEPASLNGIVSMDAAKTVILQYISPGIIAVDFLKKDWVPVIAEALPLSELLPDGRQKVTVKIREEAVWDDGSPVTAKDVEFTLKAIKIPAVNCPNSKGFFNQLEEVVLYPDEPKKYSLIYSKFFFIAATISADFNLFPKYVYDPENLTDSLSMDDLCKHPEKFEKDSKALKFAEAFNSEKFGREIVSGCGAYKLEKWETNKQIVLTRKKDWWGDKFVNESVLFQAYPSTITFEIIKDNNTALTSLKAGEIDVLAGIDFKAFTEDLPKSEKYTQNFTSYTPDFLGYQSIGINCKNKKFDDVKTRLAIAHLLDVDKMIDVIYYGLGRRTATFIHPDNEKFLNRDLKPYELNTDKSKALLAEAGWSDSDGNGVLDKKINGRKTELSIELLYNNTNPAREKIALMFQESAQKLQIKVDLKPVELSTMIDLLRQHNYEMYVGGFLSSVVETDPNQLWHSSSYTNGSNFSGFGSKESDDLIDRYRNEPDINKRAEMLKQLQKMVYDYVPVIYLISEKERIAISNKFKNVVVSSQRPGYWLGSLQLK
jgi:peptide/nickel transport system substrate-binding protein